MNDFVTFGGGPAGGEVGSWLRDVEMDPGLRRPFFNEKGDRCVSLATNRYVPAKNRAGKIVTNSDGSPVLVRERETVRIKDLDEPLPTGNATVLTKDEWIKLDTVVYQAARPRLRAWTDLASANSMTFDGFSTLILEHQTESDPGEAFVDMDMLNEERQITPTYGLEGTPLPITHAGFFLSKRRLAVSRRAGHPLDLSAGEKAGRRIGEKVEKTLIGVITGLTFGRTADYSRAPTVYGYLNFPPRVVKTNMNAPTGSNGPTVLGDFLALRELMFSQNFYGPFMVYTSTDWDLYLDNLFSTTEPSAGTLRSRLLQIEGISGIRRLDYLPNTFTVIFVQMTRDVAEAIIGMPLTTTQWEEMGGFLIKYRALTIMVPRLKADFAESAGIGVGTTA
jgi:hypothetical protein